MLAIRIRCGIIHIVVENTTDKREWLAVEHLLAKERVAGSIPGSRALDNFHVAKILKKLLTVCWRCDIIHIVVGNTADKREWLSGGASPCQGEGRGFDSRLALFYLFSHSGFNPDFFLPSEAIGNKI